MKNLALIALTVLSATSASAAGFPELYCVSAKHFENVNQINVFTNKKGTMRMNLQFYAVSEDGGDAGNFDTRNLQTITRLSFDESTGVMTNSADKVKFVVSKQAISPKKAEDILNADKGKTFDLENMSGHKILFKKYYLAKMVDFNLPGRRGNWDESLMKAYRAGVTEYVCGNIVDAKGARPSIFDGNDND